MKKVCLLLIFSACFYTAPCQIFGGEDKSKYESALEKYSQSNFGLVVAICNEILEHGNGDADVYKLRAMAYRAQGDYVRSAFDYKEALKNKRDAGLYYEKGLVLMCQKKFAEAESDFYNASRLYKLQHPLTNSDFFLYQEEFGRANHYSEKYRQAINTFKDAINNGSTMAYIDIMSSLFQNNNLAELKFYSDSLLKAPDFPLLSDSTFFNYTTALNDIANRYVTDETLNKISAAIRFYQSANSRCFQGFYNDLLYARADIYTLLGRDTLAYRQYKDLYVANDALKEVRKKVDFLKSKLSIDAVAPVIAIVNPVMDENNSVTLPARRGKQEIYVRISDSSGISAITLNKRPVTQWDDDGIFSRQMELFPGRNEIVISAIDKEDNAISKTFIINFEETSKPLSYTSDEEGFPEINSETTYHALLIAEKDYEDNSFNDLANPINDATDLKDILIRNYDFDQENVSLLTNANRSVILDTLEKICKSLTDADNLFVFYAGHGDVNRINNQIQGGFIIPSDAKKGIRSSYISNELLLAPVKNSNARHILFVLDACFGGAMFRSSMDEASQNIKNLYTYKSRYLLTSGNIEEVPDYGNFISRLKEFLTRQKEKYVPALDLYSFIQKNSESKILPQFGKMPNSGDLGGQFIFIRRDENKGIK